MAKKKEYEEKKAEAAQGPPSPFDAPLPPGVPPLTKEQKKKLEEIKAKIEVFQKELLGKFEDYVVGIGLMPPPQPQPGQQLSQEELDKIRLLILIDDTDSQKMSKLELKDKLTQIIAEMAQRSDKRLTPDTILLSELWMSCYDGKYDLLQMTALAAPIYDKGMLAAVKIGELHKSMVIKKFEKYIVSYVLFGSLVRGQATKESDIDVAIIIDDTDVKKMTRAELKDKLRAIIIGMGIDAGEMTGIRNKINIQPYILTEFWDNIKEANPVIFTILRDGVPFYDRGMFMPWKQLLKMGKIKPSKEAIDMFLSSGEQMVARVKARLKELIEADIYWATLTPTQAALMMYGIPPPTPKETIELVEEVFVKKLGLLEKKYVDTMREIRRYYKGMESGEVKEVSGKEIDDLLKRADEYLQRIKKLFTEIEQMKDKEEMVDVYDSITTIVRDILRLEGCQEVPQDQLQKTFEKKLIDTNRVPSKYARLLETLFKAKKDYDAGKLSDLETKEAKKASHELVKFLVEFIQRKRARELERARIRVKAGNKFGEILVLDNIAFITHDLDAQEREISKADVNPDGSLGTLKPSSYEELESHLAKIEIPKAVYIKSPIFDDLQRIWGRDVEVLVNRA
ncbi:nucleotidyltransferase domain-containing protein [Candidatus Woesearchaeota archaeon]|nr:nucleotidyltransferase domain-containing protein [Candidatus Woesearchaeota archaeon]